MCRCPISRWTRDNARSRNTSPRRIQPESLHPSRSTVRSNRTARVGGTTLRTRAQPQRRPRESTASRGWSKRDRDVVSPLGGSDTRLASKKETCSTPTVRTFGKDSPHLHPLRCRPRAIRRPSRRDGPSCRLPRSRAPRARWRGLAPVRRALGTPPRPSRAAPERLGQTSRRIVPETDLREHVDPEPSASQGIAHLHDLDRVRHRRGQREELHQGDLLELSAGSAHAAHHRWSARDRKSPTARDRRQEVGTDAGDSDNERRTMAACPPSIA